MARQAKTGKAGSIASGGNTTKAGSKAKQASKAGSIPVDMSAAEPNIMPIDGPGNNAAMPAQQKKRGRPKGSKNKTIRKRPEQQPITETGENTKFLLHDMKLCSLPAIDVNNPVEMENRINEYFRICADDDIKPSVASLALCFGINRITLFNWVNGKTNTLQNTKSLNTLKRAYSQINSYYEHLMNYGKINPVTGIFLLKNNMGYKDTSEHVITANTEQDPSISDITERAGLLTDI